MYEPVEKGAVIDDLLYNYGTCGNQLLKMSQEPEGDEKGWKKFIF